MWGEGGGSWGVLSLVGGLRKTMAGSNGDEKGAERLLVAECLWPRKYLPLKIEKGCRASEIVAYCYHPVGNRGYRKRPAPSTRAEVIQA
jgi:hypothetical protein